MRKFASWVVLSCIGLLVGVSYLPAAVGFFAQLYFRKTGWDIHYSTIVWKDRNLILTHLQANDPTFTIQSPLVKINVFDRHIYFLTPQVQASNIPEFGGSSNWTVSVENGVFEKDGLEPLSFSIQKGEQLKAQIEVLDGWMHVEKGDQDLRILCEKFPLSYFQLEGLLSGSFLKKDQELEWECTAQDILCSGKGSLNDWIEATIHDGDAELSIRNQDSHWEIVAKDVSATLVSKIQKIAEHFGYSAWTMENGIISGVAQISDGNLKINDASAKHLKLRKDQFTVVCEEAKISDEQYFFNGAFFAIDGNPIGMNWEGSGNFSGIGSISGSIGSFTLRSQYSGTLEQITAYLQCSGPFKAEGLIECEKSEDGWNFVLNEGKADHIEDLQLHGEINSERISCYDVKGVLNVHKKVPFHCPIIQSDGQFDLRFIHPLFDIARLSGHCQAGEIVFDLSRSHFLGCPVTQGSGSISQKTFEMECNLPWKMLTFFTAIPAIYDEQDNIACHLLIQDDIALELKSSLSIEEQRIPIALELKGSKNQWHFNSEVYEGRIEGDLLFDQEGLLVTKGKGVCEKGIQGEFSGRIATFDQGELNLSNLQVELGLFRSELKGIVKGEGIIHWKETFEADFDLSAQSFKINDWTLENGGSLHIFCSSSMGIVIQGLNIAYESANCKIGLLQYKLGDEHPIFSLTESQFYVPSELLAKFGCNHFAALQGVADLSFSSDLSKVSLSMKEALIPYEDEQLSIRNLHAIMNQNDCKINFDLDHHSRLIPIDLEFQTDSRLKGRLTIENALKVDWTYQDRLCVQSIEGKCCGVEASFHQDGESLIGSAQINGNELRWLLPEKITEVFNELKIGNGYELMGRLNFKNGLGFRGILSGKQIELFGFELRNILSHIEWDQDHLLISDLKISDFAGVLKVEKILAQGVDKDPWTLSIPHIVITELRPSLIQEIGGPPGKLSPLVVREIRIDDFYGFVDDSKTYTAKGELFFINSYKRENSILELPSDILSRIVGLDIELLTPVCGTLKYELHDGFFHFTELSNSYSENKRSEFFLVFNEDSPKMDLDWNLNIFIQTKQFVLFKFTEAFLISVKGKLDAPKFQLQRKKRFFGVL